MDNLCFSLLLLFVFFVTCFLFRFFYKHRSHYVTPNLPPGKIGLPFVGESLDFLSNGWKGHPERFIFDRIARYSYVFKTSLLGEPFIVFCSAVGNKLLFTNENKLVTSWWPESIEKIFPSSTHISVNEEAKKMRKMVLNFLKPQALQQYIEVMDTIAQRHFAMGWEGKDEVTVLPLVKQCTFWIAARLFISFEDPSHVAQFANPFKHLNPGIMSIPINLPGTPFNRAIKASNFIRKELSMIIKQRKADLAEGKASPTQDVLSHLLLATDEDGKHMTELDIANRILGLLVAGHDTVAATCTFVVKYLAEFPEIYGQVYKEQMKITKSKAPGELLNWEDIQKMKYSWNVACEVMRLVPPIGGTFRRVINDFIFNGFSIPKGWKIYWSAHSTHKNAQYFPEPEKFDPTRFEGNGPAPYTFVPFGGGPRMCPGKEYARLVILVFMHNLVKRFRWEKLLSDEKVVVDPVPMLVKGLPVHLFSHKY